MTPRRVDRSVCAASVCDSYPRLPR